MRWVVGGRGTSEYVSVGFVTTGSQPTERSSKSRRMNLTSHALIVVAVLLTAAACGPDEAIIGVDAYGEVDGALGAPLTEVHCVGTPSGIASSKWRHLKSYAIAALSARHRGIDLVANTSETTQVLRGEATYGLNDKALEDEWVQLFACRSGQWTVLGQVLTDAEGRFALTLSGTSRLPSGVRDLFLSVPGDRTNARFNAIVAPAGTNVAVTDIDGTLTASENAFTDSLVTGKPVASQVGAAAALTTLQRRGFAIVYLTARGRQFTPQTRDWLATNGFPVGALRLAPSVVMIPGQPTLDFKRDAMTALSLPVTVGIGNRAHDVQAYRAVGVTGTRVFALLPEYSSEVDPLVRSGDAVGFTAFSQVQPRFATY